MSDVLKESRETSTPRSGLNDERQDGMENTFAECAERWRRETATTSSVTKLIEHPDYQKIIALGPEVIPLIMRELQREPDHWFAALMALTGENPVPPEDAGDLDKMTHAWLALGRARGFV